MGCKFTRPGTCRREGGHSPQMQALEGQVARPGARSSLAAMTTKRWPAPPSWAVERPSPCRRRSENALGDAQRPVRLTWCIAGKADEGQAVGGPQPGANRQPRQRHRRRSAWRRWQRRRGEPTLAAAVFDGNHTLATGCESLKSCLESPVCVIRRTLTETDLRLKPFGGPGIDVVSHHQTRVFDSPSGWPSQPNSNTDLPAISPGDMSRRRLAMVSLVTFVTCAKAR
jgi:hypothetical protein